MHDLSSEKTSYDLPTEQKMEWIHHITSFYSLLLALLIVEGKKLKITTLSNKLWLLDEYHCVIMMHTIRQIKRAPHIQVSLRFWYIVYRDMSWKSMWSGCHICGGVTHGK